MLNYAKMWVQKLLLIKTKIIEKVVETFYRNIYTLIKSKCGDIYTYVHIRRAHTHMPAREMRYLFRIKKY